MSVDPYEAFLAAKRVQIIPAGFEPEPISSPLFPFQRDVVAWAVRTGRAAIYADCGLGKTGMQLEWARQVANHTGGPVIILAPLAVAQQTVREGAKFGIDVAYRQAGADVLPTDRIVVTNYERLAAFDTPVFSGVVLDEASILKAFMGATKRRIVDAFARTPYKLAASATPAPNDHLELGNQSEFLGVLSSHEMIARWFINDTSTFGTYRVKGHAVVDYWNWVASWARCFGRPSDLGTEYSDAGYELPELELHKHVIDIDVVDGRGDGALFRLPEMSATAIHAERRRTSNARAARIAELVAAEPNEPWLIWCETDYEADALTARIKDAVEVRGSDSLEKKERALVGFTTGDVRVLVTKAKIAGFGLNFQHCARVAFVAATYSYEAFYQSIRRCHRFGQTRPVHVHVALAPTELAVWEVLTRKQDDHDAMKTQMFAAMRRAQERVDKSAKEYAPKLLGRLPAWLLENEGTAA